MDKPITIKIILGQRGETVMELLVATLILAVTLTVIISVFISGRTGVVKSWERTNEYECAAYIVEQLKALPYANLVEWEERYRESGEAREINSRNAELSLAVDNQCVDMRNVQFDLLQYKSYPIEEMLEVTIRVRQATEDAWVEKGSLLRKGE